MNQKLITYPCCFLFDRETITRMNLYADARNDNALPAVAKNPTRLAQAIANDAKELSLYSDEISHDVTNAMRTTGIIQYLEAAGTEPVQLLVTHARIEYLNDALAPDFTRVIDTGTGPAEALLIIPCQKEMSYTKRAYASRLAVSREFSILQDILPPGFAVTQHICSVTCLGTAEYPFRKKA